MSAPVQATGHPAGTLSSLRALLDLAAAVRSRDDLTRLLEATAASVAQELGFAAVVVNMYRPAWDDYEVVVDEDHDDALLVPLTASDGRRLAFLSLDEPLDGRRPSDAELEGLSAVAAIVASVIEHGQLAAEAARGSLEAAEWAEIRRHPELGARILEHANMRDVASWVLAHHERVDGGGYPHGLSGDRIPLEGRILAVADAFEAMTADRPYRGALDEATARAELVRGAGTQFDADVVAAFLRVLDA